MPAPSGSASTCASSLDEDDELELLDELTDEALSSDSLLELSSDSLLELSSDSVLELEEESVPESGSLLWFPDVALLLPPQAVIRRVEAMSVNRSWCFMESVLFSVVGSVVQYSVAKRLVPT